MCKGGLGSTCVLAMPASGIAKLYNPLYDVSAKPGAYWTRYLVGELVHDTFKAAEPSYVRRMVHSGPP